MLTDYHVHLRPDGPDTEAEKYFTDENVQRYLSSAAENGVDELGISEHIYRFKQALSIWDHEYWRKNAIDDLEAYCHFIGSQADLKLGIEADYIPGREDVTSSLLEEHDFDYVIGSVHFVGEHAVDHLDYDIWNTGVDSEKVWTRYFELLAEAARSGLFDIMAHPDLVKVWGKSRPWPERDLAFYYEPAVEAIAEADVAIEVSTAGLRKPVGELYPSTRFMEMCIDAGVVVSLSSDAHLPEHVGYGYKDALGMLEQFGVATLSEFKGRQRTQRSLTA